MHCNALSHWVPLGAALLAALLPRRLVSPGHVDQSEGSTTKKHQKVVSLGDFCWGMNFPTLVF